MENQIALLDTSILIDYYRKKDKSRTVLIQLYKTHAKFIVSVITHYEIYIGATSEQIPFWDNFFTGIIILPVDTEVSKVAVKLNSTLKQSSSLIDIPDLLIAATAITHNFPLATLNTKHFARIKELALIAH